MNVSLERFAKFLLKLFFEMLMDGWSKNSNNLFTKTPMDASEWMNKKWKWLIVERRYWCQIIDYKICIGNVLFFFKKILWGRNKILLLMLTARWQCIDFQMAFKMCYINNHSDLAQRLNKWQIFHNLWRD